MIRRRSVGYQHDQPCKSLTNYMIVRLLYNLSGLLTFKLLLKQNHRAVTNNINNCMTDNSSLDFR
jgi:hypothetical protein